MTPPFRWESNHLDPEPWSPPCRPRSRGSPRRERRSTLLCQPLRPRTWTHGKWRWWAGSRQINIWPIRRNQFCVSEDWGLPFSFNLFDVHCKWFYSRVCYWPISSLTTTESFKERNCIVFEMLYHYRPKFSTLEILSLHHLSLLHV